MIKPCPLCRGRKFIVASVGEDFDCVYCANSGTVDTDKVCGCGKPGVRLVDEFVICMSNLCANKAQAGGFS